jgi:HEPN domain-containing protein
MDRYTSMGISNDAEQFLEAARILRSKKGQTFAPLYFLTAQSIELSLKAYLRGAGWSDKHLRTLGHNLNKCLQAAIDNGVEEHVPLSQAHADIIGMINPYYAGKDLQYSRAGLKTYPDLDSLITVGEDLWKGLRSFCVEHRERHSKKPTRVS